MKIKEYLEKTRLTQKEFSSLVGVSQSHVSNIMGGVKNPSIQLINKIETLTKGEVTVTDLLHPEAPSRLKTDQTE